MNSDFDKVAGRLKEKLKVGQDKELAELLGLSKENFSNKKVKGTIPFREVIDLCNQKGFSLDEIFFGIKLPKQREEYSAVEKILIKRYRKAVGLRRIVDDLLENIYDDFSFHSIHDNVLEGIHELELAIPDFQEKAREHYEKYLREIKYLEMEDEQ